MKTIVKLIPIILLAIGTIAIAGIRNSKHDLRPSSSDSGQDITGLTEICKPCHVPHNGRNSDDGLLWNHTYTTSAFVFYDGTTGPITGESKLCLGCHDGVTGVDNYRGGPNNNTGMIASYANLTLNLQDDHPVGIIYPANGTVGFNNQESVTSTLKLPNGNVECSSCHNPHDNTTGNGKFQRIDNTGSILCLTCHRK